MERLIELWTMIVALVKAYAGLVGPSALMLLYGAWRVHRWVYLPRWDWDSKPTERWRRGVKRPVTCWNCSSITKMRFTRGEPLEGARLRCKLCDMEGTAKKYRERYGANAWWITVKLPEGKA